MRRKVLSLARFPNVYLKVHGLGEICRRTSPVTGPFPFERDGLAILDMAHKAFGPNRMMWGSDYPPVSGREGYGNALLLMMHQIGLKGEVDKQLIFGSVVLRLFNFR